jgi:DNA-binding NtrC family response regulator
MAEILVVDDDGDIRERLQLALVTWHGGGAMAAAIPD